MISRLFWSVKKQLKAKVAELGAQISRDYEGKNLCSGVHPERGSVVFMADLMRAVTIPLQHRLHGGVQIRRQ